MFALASTFNQNIGAWNTGAVTNMAAMFFLASAFNQNIEAWNTGAVTNMSNMFAQASAFNQSIGAWNTGAVTTMSSMFNQASAFNQNIGAWNTGAVTNMQGMFQLASSFNQNIGAWVLKPGVDLSNMFDNCGVDCSNYSATLIGWNANPSTPNGITLGAIGLLYLPSAVSARTNLIGAKGWAITGDAFSSGLVPTITSFAPTSGAIGSSVTITGTNFSTVVKFNGISAVVSAFTSTSITTTVPVGATTGTISVTLGCNTATSSSVFTVGSTPSITITTQPTDFTACVGQTATFTTAATGTTNITYQWQYSPDGIVPFVDLTNTGGYSNVGTSSFTINSTGNFGAGKYQCKINGDFAPTVYSNTVSFSVNALPPTPIALGVNNCGSGSITLTASGGSAGQYMWYDTGGLISGQINSTYVTPVISATTTYSVSINNGTCVSQKASVIATINSIPSAPAATPGSNCGTSAITLNASGGTNGQYRWYTISSGGTAITGEVNSSYTTPSISSTTSYYVSINNGTCESSRIPVVATINLVLIAPSITNASGCANTLFTLNAAGGSNGQYRWYTVVTGGTAIAGQVNSSYVTPTLTSSTTYYVSINNGTCESSRTPLAVTIITSGCTPPTIDTKSLATQVGGKVTLDLIPLIKTPGSSLDINSIQITSQPKSGAKASITNGVLTIDYTGVTFSGIEQLGIRACDQTGSCATQQFDIEVAGDIVVYNGLAPNGHLQNQKFIIEFIDVLPETKNNKVTIFDRWENQVWQGTNYDNNKAVFTGISDGGNDLPAGTYFYKIEFSSGRKTQTGFISLKR